MNNPLPLIQSIKPYIIGALFAVVGEFVTGFIKEFFSERARIAKHKLDVARLVLQICNEAATSNYKNPPRDMEHVNSVIVDLSGVNVKKAGKMNVFVKEWKSESDLYGLSYLESLTAKRKELSGWATEVRNGRS